MSNLEIGLICIGVLGFLVAIGSPIWICSYWRVLCKEFTGISGPRALGERIKSSAADFAGTWTLRLDSDVSYDGYVSLPGGGYARLFNNAHRLWLSALPGVLAVASVFGGRWFRASQVSHRMLARAMGRIAFPEMVKYNYDPKLAAGTLSP